MKLVENIAAKIPTTANVMLTCFTTNEKAVRFYEKVGFTKDEFSPPPKVLRNGNKVELDYVILSKAISR
jgi:N-alpha-acetyltransferase 40